ncbi:MAG: hypothetical protein M3292_03920 [Actinomycetota bacterium]|nr:hypothetical protein [Actinomycetota bacterium]
MAKDEENASLMKTNGWRGVPLPLTMLIAIVTVLVGLTVFGGNDASARGATVHRQTAVSNAELALRNEMRRLWEDHVTWTRLAIISLTTDSPDTKATVARLLRNQTDIGNAVKPFYGAAAGKRLTALLREHILIAAELIGAARKGDQAAVARQQARWTTNANRIAMLLSTANPRFWKLGPMRAMLHEHLRLTTNEVVARLEQNWAADVRAYDKIRSQALHMADMLSRGIVKQFPERFRYR